MTDYQAVAEQILIFMLVIPALITIVLVTGITYN